MVSLTAGFCPGCSPSKSEAGSTLRVFAAASLTEAFRDVEQRFEAIRPNVDVELSFAGSQALRLQLEQGAYADLFASANQKHMEALVNTRIVSRSEVLAHNHLVLIVPTSNPAAINSFRDLPRASRLVIGTANVPVGFYTRKLFENARSLLGDDFVKQVRKRIASEEVNVRLVRAKVELGEADAAIVYRTDAIATRGVRVVEIPDAINPRATYYIGQVTSAKNPKLGRAFVDFVRSDQGRSTLARHGFLRACLIGTDRIFRSTTVQDARSRDEGLATLFRGANDAADWTVPPERRVEGLLRHALTGTK